MGGDRTLATVATADDLNHEGHSRRINLPTERHRSHPPDHWGHRPQVGENHARGRVNLPVHSTNPVTQGVSHGVGFGGLCCGLDTPDALPQSFDRFGLRLIHARNVMNVGVRRIASRRGQPYFDCLSDGLHEHDRTLHAKVGSIDDYITHLFTSFLFLVGDYILTTRCSNVK